MSKTLYTVDFTASTRQNYRFEPQADLLGGAETYTGAVDGIYDMASDSDAVYVQERGSTFLLSYNDEDGTRFVETYEISEVEFEASDGADNNDLA